MENLRISISGTRDKELNLLVDIKCEKSSLIIISVWQISSWLLSFLHCEVQRKCNRA